ncbi:MAG TPA: M1 family metallopeptidase [Bacteroidia bacterium]|nr:M1 family metallopeptidase [Bacteroidia bacterium]
MKRKPILFFSSLILIAGCSIIGVHFKIHNPHRAGKFPEKTEARVLLGNEDSKYRTCYDVKYYKLNVIFPDQLKKDHSISGFVVIGATAKKDFDTLQIDLAKQFQISRITANDIHHPEKALFDFSKMSEAKFFRKENAVFVIMPRHILASESFGISIQYSGIPVEAKRPPWAGGFVRKEDKLKKTWWGVACEGEGASTWWPCKDVLNDEPDSVDVILSVPDYLAAISNGKLISTETPGLVDGKDRTNWHWHVSYPINIYDITFYIGNYKLLHDTYYSEVTHDTLQLNHYVLEQNYDIAKTHFQQLKKYLAFYEKTFGPYPWYRDGFKLVESPYEGMEHQSAIAYGNGFKNDPVNGFDYIILHETAHEWWGNAVTANDLSDMWLHEGFATYAEALYVESTKGHIAYLNYLLQYRIFIINRRPVVGEQGIRYFNYKDTDIYMKGAWVLHSLRYAIGNDSLFFDILHSFYMENRMKEISSDALEEIVNRKTGKDFHWFFEQYLHNRFTPELEYCVSDGKLFYRWGKTNPDFKIQVGHTISDQPGFTAIYPVADQIQSEILENPKQPIFFNTNEFLFKPVENKNLAKEFKKQK